MSYDPYNQEFETLMSDILKAFDSCPMRAKKLLLSNLLEKVSTLITMLEEKGGKVSEEEIYFTLTTRFDKIELLRLEEARKFLVEIMKKELP